MCGHRTARQRRYVLIVLGLSAALLAGRGAIAGAAPPAPATKPAAPAPKATELLERKLPEVNLRATPFQNALDVLHDASNANLCVDWRRLEAAGIDRKAPVTLTARDTKFADVLTKVLAQLGGKDHPLAYAPWGEMLFISTPAGTRAFSAAAAAAAAANPKDRASLDRKLPELKMDGVGLEDAFDFLKDVTKLPVEIDWKALAAAGVKRDTKVTVALYGATLGQGLWLMLDSDGQDGKDLPVMITVRNGRIVTVPVAAASPRKAEGAK